MAAVVAADDDKDEDFDRYHLDVYLNVYLLTCVYWESYFCLCS